MLAESRDIVHRLEPGHHAETRAMIIHPSVQRRVAGAAGRGSVCTAAGTTVQQLADISEGGAASRAAHAAIASPNTHCAKAPRLSGEA